MMICRPADGRPDRGGRPRLPRRLRLEGIPGDAATVCGIALPPGLRESDRLPEPIFTPATKAELGEHDENIDFDGMIEHIALASGRDVAAAAAEAIRDQALASTVRGRVAARRGILLADTKFEFGSLAPTPKFERGGTTTRLGDGRPRDRLILIDEVADARFVAVLGCRVVRARPAAGELRQAVRARLARDPAVGQDGARARAARRRRRGHPRALRRGVRADHRRQLRALSRGGRHRPMTQLPVRGQRHAEARDPRSAGPGGRGQPRPPRHRGRQRRPGRPARRADRRAADEADGPRGRRAAGRELLSNPLIEAYAIEPIAAASSTVGAGARRLTMPVRIGVVVFPGSNCDRDTLHALELAGRRAGRPVARAGVARRRRRGRPAGRVRLRRLPARRRDRPVQPGHAGRRGVRADGGLVLGICNGFQVLAEAGLVPGRAAAQPRRCGSPAGRSRSPRSGSTRRSRTRSASGRPLRMPVAHGEGCYFADDATLDALERDGQVLFRYVDADGDAGRTGRRRRTRTARCGRSPASSTPPATSPGLMPHPERAAEAILGSDDGLGDPPLARRERRASARRRTAVAVARRGRGAAMTVAERPVRAAPPPPRA